MKSVLFLEGALGQYDSLLKTHKPLTVTGHHLFLGRVQMRLGLHTANLVEAVKKRNLCTALPTMSPAQAASGFPLPPVPDVE